MDYQQIETRAKELQDIIKNSDNPITVASADEQLEMLSEALATSIFGMQF